jgi:hypothetical protein
MTAWQGMLRTAKEAAQAGIITIKGFKDGLELGHGLELSRTLLLPPHTAFPLFINISPLLNFLFFSYSFLFVQYT